MIWTCSIWTVVTGANSDDNVILFRKCSQYPEYIDGPNNSEFIEISLSQRAYSRYLASVLSLHRLMSRWCSWDIRLIYKYGWMVVFSVSYSCSYSLPVTSNWKMFEWNVHYFKSSTWTSAIKAMSGMHEYCVYLCDGAWVCDNKGWKSANTTRERRRMQKNLKRMGKIQW